MLEELRDMLLNRDATLQRLQWEHQNLIHQFSLSFQKLEVSEMTASQSIGTLQQNLESEKSASKAKEAEATRLANAIDELQKERDTQIKSFDAAREKYETQIAEYESKLKESQEQNQQLKDMIRYMISYISDPLTILAFYGWLAKRGIKMEWATFETSMAQIRTMSPDQLMIVMNDGFLGLLEEEVSPAGSGEKEENIPPMPVAEIVPPHPFIQVSDAEVVQEVVKNDGSNNNA